MKRRSCAAGQPAEAILRRSGTSRDDESPKGITEKTVRPGAALAAVAALALSACAANETDTPTSTDSSGAASNLSGTLQGTGASSAKAAQEVSRANFQSANPGVTVNYSPDGSGAGRDRLQADGGAAFAGSDRALRTTRWGRTSSPAARRQHAAEPADLCLPDRVIYNVEGVDDLHLDADVIAEASSAARSSNWNDPEIAALNSGVIAARPGDHPGAPLGRLGHHRELHRPPWRRSPPTCGRTRPSGDVAGIAWPVEAAQGHLRRGHRRQSPERAPSATPTNRGLSGSHEHGAYRPRWVDPSSSGRPPMRRPPCWSKRRQGRRPRRERLGARSSTATEAGTRSCWSPMRSPARTYTDP